jgi:hypothetical protein
MEKNKLLINLCVLFLVFILFLSKGKIYSQENEANGSECQITKSLDKFLKQEKVHYNLSTILQLESHYFRFNLTALDSVARTIVDSVYFFIEPFSLTTQKDIIEFCKKLDEILYSKFYLTTHHYLHESLEKLKDEPSGRAPANCVRFASLYKSVFYKYSYTHPKNKTEMFIIRIGNGRKSHVIPCFELSHGQKVYWDPNLNREVTAQELYEDFEVTEQSINNKLYCKPLSPIQNLNNELIHYAYQLKQIGRYKDALELIDYLLESDPYFADALYSKSSWFLEMGDLAASSRTAKFILKLDSTSAKAAYTMGKIAHKNMNCTEAINWYQKAIQWSNGYIDPEYWLARLYIDKNELEKAEEIGLNFLRDVSPDYATPGRDILKRVNQKTNR